MKLRFILQIIILSMFHACSESDNAPGALQLTDIVGYWNGPLTSLDTPNIRCVQHFYEIREDWIGYDIEVHRGVRCDEGLGRAYEREFLKSALYLINATATNATVDSMNIAGECRGTVSTCPQGYSLSIKRLKADTIVIKRDIEETFIRADKVRDN